MSCLPKIATSCLFATKSLFSYVFSNHNKVMIECSHTQAPKELTSRTEELAKQMGIVPSVEVHDNSFIAKLGLGATAFGCNFPSSKPSIELDDTMKHSFEQNCGLVAHELVHIKNSDHLRWVAINSAALIVLVLCPPLLGQSFWARSLEMAAFCSVSKILNSLYSTHREKVADLEASNHMSTKELAAYTKLFITGAFNNLVYRQQLVHSNSLVGKIYSQTITSHGNFLLDLDHPLITTRIAYLKKALHQRADILPLSIKIDGKSVTLKQVTVAKMRSMILEKDREDAFIDLIEIDVNTKAKKNNIKLKTLDGGNPTRTIGVKRLHSSSVTDIDQKIVTLFDKILNTPKQLILEYELEPGKWKQLRSNPRARNQYIREYTKLNGHFGKIDKKSIEMSHENDKYTIRFAHLLNSDTFKLPC